MKCLRMRTLALTIVLACATLSDSGSSYVLAQCEADFVPLFNGRDLSGWAAVNCAPETFTVRDGMIVSTGVPTGVLRTERQYENFILELEWMHLHEGGNAGLFVWSDAITSPSVPFTRSIEVQILDGRNSENYTSHGDVFAIHGARLTPDRPHPAGAMRCLPSERRANPAGEWNHYRVECRDGVLKLAVNGKIVSGGSDCSPRKGYICLESEGSECHFRNLRILEIPPSGASGDDVAKADVGFRSLYTGLDFRGWRMEPGSEGHWQANNWRISYDGKSTAKDRNLWTEQSYGDFVLVADWRLTRKAAMKPLKDFTPDGLVKTDADGKIVMHDVLDAGDSGLYVRGSTKAQINIWCQPMGSGDINSYHKDASLTPERRMTYVPKVNADRPPGQWNRFEVTVRGKQITVVLNGQTVIDAAELPDMPERGPIALQSHGDPVEFANIYVRELE